MCWFEYPPYVSVAERRAKASKEMAKLAKKGRVISPVVIEGRTIARTFWGKAWCNHLESYSDYSNRLPRGRTYVRNGSVVDLQIKPGAITAIVSGSSLYEVEITIDKLAANRWESIKQQCAGQIGSMIELLQGKLSDQVMRLITDRDAGLFPAPKEIEKSCSCPDSAIMCKHVAAVLYGVGSRFDHKPELLFALRKVDHLELIAKATALDGIGQASSDRKTVAGGDLADVFGIELDEGAGPAEIPATSAPPPQPVVVVATPPKATRRVRPQAKKSAKARAPKESKARAKAAREVVAKTAR